MKIKLSKFEIICYVVLDPISIGIISTAIYDSIKHGKKFVVPGFRGFIVDCINDTSFDKYGINEKTLFEFFELEEIKKEIANFRKNGTEPNLLKFSQVLNQNSSIKDKKIAENFLKDFFKLIEEKIISNPKIHQKISLHYNQKILDKVNQISDTVSESSETQKEILDKIVNRNIEDNFDTKTQSVNEIISNLGIINNKLHTEDSEYEINANLKGPKPIIEISHKNFKNMSKIGMMFSIKLKLKNKKAVNLQDFFKKGKGKKLKLNPEEIEEFSFTKNDKVMYTITNPQNVSYEIKPSQRTLPLYLRIPNSTEKLDYLLFTIKEKNKKIIVNNYQQKDSPIWVELQVDTKTQKSRLRIKANDDQYTLTAAYNYIKFHNAMMKNKKIQIFDPKINKVIQEFTYPENQDEVPINDKSLDLLSKLIEIGNILDIKFPWPPESFSQDEADDIFLVYDVLKTGKSKLSFQSDMKGTKSEKAFQIFTKEIKAKGYAKYRIKIIEPKIVRISAFDIDLGTFSSSGKVTTDMPPKEFLKIYDEASDDQELVIPISTLGSNITVFPKWNPEKRSKNHS